MRGFSVLDDFQAAELASDTRATTESGPAVAALLKIGSVRLATYCDFPLLLFGNALGCGIAVGVLGIRLADVQES